MMPDEEASGASSSACGGAKRSCELSLTDPLMAILAAGEGKPAEAALDQLMSHLYIPKHSKQKRACLMRQLHGSFSQMHLKGPRTRPKGMGLLMRETVGFM